MAIELTRIEEFAVLTLNRPDALNALSFALIEELGRAFEQVHGSVRGRPHYRRRNGAFAPAPTSRS
jgi:enoyl-CoA hydratase/carnithine racemase